MVNKLCRDARLSRQLGLLSLTLMGVGVILGAGIYVLIGKAAALAGDGLWVSFVIAAIVAGLTGLSYSELSSMFPKSGAEFEYVRHAFSRRFGFLAGWMTAIAGIVSIAAVALGFGGYFESVFGFPAFQAAFLIIIFGCLVLLFGVKFSMRIGITLTLLEVLGLLAIIAISLPFFGNVKIIPSEPVAGGILSGAALVFFAFLGFEEITRMSEEAKNPRKNVPRALLLAIVISTVIYILVAFSALGVLGAHGLAESKAPLADVAAKAYGANAFGVIGLLALLSTGSTVLLLMLSLSRLVFGMAKGSALPEQLCMVSKKAQVPWLSVFLVTGLAWMSIFSGDIKFIAETTDFLLFAVFIIVNFSVIWLRFSRPDLERGFRIPISIFNVPVLPLFGIIASLALMASLRLEVMLAGFAAIAAGAAYYHFFAQHRNFHFRLH